MSRIQGSRSLVNTHEIHLGEVLCTVHWTDKMARQFFEDVKAANVEMHLSFAVMRLDRARFVPVYSDYSSVSRALRSLTSLVHGFFLFLMCDYRKYDQIHDKIEQLKSQEVAIVPEARLEEKVHRLEADLDRMQSELGRVGNHGHHSDLALLQQNQVAFERFQGAALAQGQQIRSLKNKLEKSRSTRQSLQKKLKQSRSTQQSLQKKLKQSRSTQRSLRQGKHARRLKNQKIMRVAQVLLKKNEEQVGAMNRLKRANRVLSRNYEPILLRLRRESGLKLDLLSDLASLKRADEEVGALTELVVDLDRERVRRERDIAQLEEERDRLSKYVDVMETELDGKSSDIQQLRAKFSNRNEEYTILLNCKHELDWDVHVLKEERRLLSQLSDGAESRLGEVSAENDSLRRKIEDMGGAINELQEAQAGSFQQIRTLEDFVALAEAMVLAQHAWMYTAQRRETAQEGSQAADAARDDLVVDSARKEYDNLFVDMEKRIDYFRQERGLSALREETGDAWSPSSFSTFFGEEFSPAAPQCPVMGMPSRPTPDSSFAISECSSKCASPSSPPRLSTTTTTTTTTTALPTWTTTTTTTTALPTCTTTTPAADQTSSHHLRSSSSLALSISSDCSRDCVASPSATEGGENAARIDRTGTPTGLDVMESQELLVLRAFLRCFERLRAARRAVEDMQAELPKQIQSPATAADQAQRVEIFTQALRESRESELLLEAFYQVLPQESAGSSEDVSGQAQSLAGILKQVAALYSTQLASHTDHGGGSLSDCLQQTASTAADERMSMEQRIRHVDIQTTINHHELREMDEHLDQLEQTIMGQQQPGEE